MLQFLAYQATLLDQQLSSGALRGLLARLRA
jgi:hypothetical protein